MNKTISKNIHTLHTIIDKVNIGVALLNEQNQIIFWNQFMEKHSGIAFADLSGKNIFEVFSYIPRQWLELKLKSVRLIKNYSFVSWTQRPYLFKFKHTRMITDENIEFMHQDCTFIPIINPETRGTYVCITIHDMTDVVASQQKITEINDINRTLEQITSHDTLTSIYNRAYVERQIELEFSKSRKNGHVFSIILFDIDKFKNINDTFGHIAGDNVLKHLAMTVKSELRESDIFGRYGGEEFFILLPETDQAESIALAERLRKAVAASATPHDRNEITITISLGAVQYRSETDNYLQMIHDADIALYHSKKNGRNAVSLYKPSGCELINPEKHL